MPPAPPALPRSPAGLRGFPRPGARAFAQSLAFARVLQQTRDRPPQLGRVPDLHERPRLPELVANLLEVLHVGADDHRAPRHAGLEDVVPARRDQAAADEDDGRERIGLRELSHRIEEEHVAVTPGRGAECRSPDDAVPRTLRERDHVADALGMAGRDQQPQAGHFRARLATACRTSSSSPPSCCPRPRAATPPPPPGARPGPRATSRRRRGRRI
jgi:hypothetical protein